MSEPEIPPPRRARYNRLADALEVEAPDGEPLLRLDRVATEPRLNGFWNRCYYTDWSGGRGEWQAPTEAEWIIIGEIAPWLLKSTRLTF